ncbi:MAG TPA: VWA domain-containing protein [Anaerolineales bacterium]|nr:VWA domain-containing protein [Anaerolineales bacterium]
MDWLWPGFLLLLGLMPLIVAAYIWMLRRRRRFAVRYSSLALVRAALPHPSRLRRHLPFALFLLALTSLVIALGRPVAIVSVPTGQATIILAMDVSRSMCATDIQPNRLEAAKAAALSFIQRQPSSTQIGIVAFAGFAELIQAPTTDQELLQDAVESLITARRTAIGSAILKSLDAIAEIDPNVAPSVSGPAPGIQPMPVPNGAYAPEIIVLLTDGVSNAGPLPLEAAQQAVDRGVRVYTIGFGTESENQSIPFCGQQFQGGDPFGGGGQFGGGGGGRFRRGIDETTLKQIADMSGGTYYSATSAGELQNVFQTLPTYLITRHETMEISVAFTAIGALLAAMAIALSLIWHPLP